MLIHGKFRSDYDSYVYFRNLLADLFMYLLLYINYMLFASNNISKTNNLNNQLSNEFEMKDLCATRRYLSILICKTASKKILHL